MLAYGPDTSLYFAQESLYCHSSSSRKNRKGLHYIQADSGVDKSGSILLYFVSETFGKLETMVPFPSLGIRTLSLPRYSLLRQPRLDQLVISDPDVVFVLLSS